MLINITINGWEKYNPRNDRKNHVWFRMQNSFFTDQKIFGLSGDQQRIFLFLLCEASKQNESEFVLNTDYASKILGIEKSELVNSLNVLQDIDLIKPSDYQKPTKSRLKANQSPRFGIATNRQTDNTDITIQAFEKKIGKVMKIQPPAAPDPVSKIIGVYYRSYESRYGVKLRITGKDVGILKRLVEQMGILPLWLLDYYLSVTRVLIVSVNCTSIIRRINLLLIVRTRIFITV